MKQALNTQSLALDAAKTLIADLRTELLCKENDAEKSKITMEANVAEWRVQFKVLISAFRPYTYRSVLPASVSEREFSFDSIRRPKGSRSARCSSIVT